MRWLVAILVALAWAMPARADDNRPLSVQLEAAGEGRFTARWKVPANVAARHVPQLSAAGCAAEGASRNWSDALGHWREEDWRCDAVPGALTVDYPFANPALATIVRFTPEAGGSTTTIVAPAEQGQIALSEEQAGATGWPGFLGLGVEHILIGFDHLLFVAGLIFIAGTWRRVLVTITGFTLAHSVTLALSALDIVRLPIAAIEAVIALSIVFLAVEIVKGRRDTLTWRRPVVVAAAFGLLHGFGFAAVLREIGLPDEGFAAALLAFNVGIEIGQVIFAALVLGVIALLERFGPKASATNVPRFAGYGVGILATYWMIERLAGAL
ncbi:HupE/UreJ family protein [Aurantiacibacter sp. MUD11]|uniref:HupE/UreJ family protein n=1 Tax=Aurantiacibacter sp. MUD11 TaxID=3003265 RepID=UPI0022AB259E|nr:HupE/UreJ family protein [Aurantiacibacter sp. MUD11]WAT19373.1 HupE/UreJ family protein [Aurantiacibacter sp. MUD11]